MDAQASPFSVQADDTARLDASADFQTIRQYLANQQGRRYVVLQVSQALKSGEPRCMASTARHYPCTDPTALISSSLFEGKLEELSPGCSVSLLMSKTGAPQQAVQVLPQACIVTHVLQSEPTIRVVVAASRLSHYIHNADDKRSNPPTFSFWLHSLRTALHNDPFWGPGYWEEIEARALRLEKDIQHLLRQCRELEEILAFKSSGLEEKGGIENLPRITESTAFTATRIRHSTLAKRQLALITEEQEWMRRIVLAWWRALLADAACERRKGSLTRRPFAPPRARSLTS
ncbi:MAG: hypothetical protein M1830_003863 [Pleopsidium flavum]|nr:MAG: hypothetical protein M1830_003863 [Pleopsidium flavum]